MDMADDSFNRLPAGLMAPAGSDSKDKAPQMDAYSDIIANNGGSTGSSLPLILSIVALLLAASALFFSVSKTSEPVISQVDRESLRAIASDLRQMQKKEFTLSSQDTQTVVKIEKSFPLSDILPDDFSVPISFSIPLQAQVQAISTSGQVVPLRISENITVRAQVPFNLSKADSAEMMVHVNQDMPVSTRIRGTIPISVVFPSEFNSIITKLEAMGEEPAQR